MGICVTIELNAFSTITIEKQLDFTLWKQANKTGFQNVLFLKTGEVINSITKLLLSKVCYVTINDNQLL